MKKKQGCIGTLFDLIMTIFVWPLWLLYMILDFILN